MREMDGRIEVMTSLARNLGLGLVVVAMTQVSASAAKVPHHRAAAPRTVPAPQYLHDRIEELGRGFDGLVGIAVKSIDDGWETGWRDHDLYPQQSVSKLWVAITALDAVDKGQVSLDDKVTLTKDDLTLF